MHDDDRTLLERAARLDEARRKMERAGVPSLAALIERFAGWDAPEVSGEVLRKRAAPARAAAAMAGEE